MKDPSGLKLDDENPSLHAFHGVSHESSSQSIVLVINSSTDSPFPKSLPEGSEVSSNFQGTNALELDSMNCLAHQPYTRQPYNSKDNLIEKRNENDDDSNKQHNYYINADRKDDGLDPSGIDIRVPAHNASVRRYANDHQKNQVPADPNVILRSNQNQSVNDSSLSASSVGSTTSQQETFTMNSLDIGTNSIIKGGPSLGRLLSTPNVNQQPISSSVASLFQNQQPSTISRVMFRSVISDSQGSSHVNSGSVILTSSHQHRNDTTTTRENGGEMINHTIEISEKDITFVNDTIDGVHELQEGSRLSFAGHDATLPLAIDNERFFLDNIDSKSVLSDDKNPNQCVGYRCMLMESLHKVQSMRKQTSPNQSSLRFKNNYQEEHWRPADSEVTTVLGKLWRFIFRKALFYSTDRINSLLMSRNAGHSLQEYLTFLTAYESFILGGVIKEYDINDTNYHRQLAFNNRNTSRIITQQVLRFNRWAWFYHLSTGMTYSRPFSFLSQFFNFFAFPITENESTHKYDRWYSKLIRLYHCLSYTIGTSPVLRTILCCNYFREDYYDRDYRNRASINLGAEAHGIESYNMEKYGTYYGRKETAKFRQEHRLNIDESIVRSFMSNPIGTMIHNGIEHCLLCVTKHWKNMLYQNNGNFAHQRLEQLSPFDVLREAIPEVLCTLSGIRGRNEWDMHTLGPFVRKLQSLDPGRLKRKTPRSNKHDMDLEPGIKKESSLVDYNSGIKGSFDNDEMDHEDEEEDEDREILNPCYAAQKLIIELKSKIVPNVCGMIPSRMDVFNEWLDAIHDSFYEVSKEALEIRNFVRTVDIGIKLGYEMLRVVNWHVPSDLMMKTAIVNCILDKKDMKLHYKQLNSVKEDCDSKMIPRELIIAALSKLASKDERTLRELVHQNFHHTVKAGVLLLNRAKTMLIREMRRDALDNKILEISKGDVISDVSELLRNNWYWVYHPKDTVGWIVVVYNGIQHKSDSIIKEDDTLLEGEHVLLKFHDSVTGVHYVFDYNDSRDQQMDSSQNPKKLQILKYVPVAEAISRAQKVYMTIELDHGKRFSYNTFMEFGSAFNDKSLRNRLSRLATLAQIHSYELDKARLNVLTETKNSVNNPNKKRDFSFAKSRCILEARPQNAIFLGGGPTGLLGAIHCLHNVILTGGEVKVYEARDAFDQEASSFERAQIVRLDNRLVAMLRYHLGTGFEDVFIPARGESFAHLGNSLPAQGFVEVTIKRLESMLLDEVINIRSKGLLHFYSDSAMTCYGDCGSFQKMGRSLKQGDLLYDPDVESGSLTVRSFVYEACLQTKHLVVGKDYDVIHPREKRVRCYRLVRADKDFDFYHLSPHEPGVRDISGGFSQLPPIFAKGCGRTDPVAIILENEDLIKKRWEFDAMKNQNFQLDVSNCHVVLALGKPTQSGSHFAATTSEPYAILCIEGLKISKGMHNFGEKRYGEGIKDDYRTQITGETSNTRIVGDFMKSIRIASIITTMEYKLQNEALWRYHFDQLAGTCNDKIPAIHAQLLSAMAVVLDTSFKRFRLQTRFFELGNSYYLGMEIPREYHEWKQATVAKIAPDKCHMTPDPVKMARKAVQSTLAGHIDRLWYDAVLDVLRKADVYEIGGRRKIPIFYTIDSPFEIRLGELEEMDDFRMFRRTYSVHLHEGNGFTQIRHQHENSEFRIPTKTYVLDLSTNSKKTLGELGRDDHFEPIDTFEVLSKARSFSIVRTSGGYICRMPHDVRVGRVSDLSRKPDGYSESNVALATFPVQHFVNHRCLRVNRVRGKRGEDGYITAHVGDAQASPHFMRYSGLTGAGINVMSFNNLVGQALRGVEFEARIQRYAFETNWSSGEVVHRGTGNCYGQDGFLRPGFTYSTLIDYLYEKMKELFEIGAPEQALLSRDWKIRISAAIAPRGIENDTLFYNALLAQLETAIKSKMRQESKLVGGDKKLSPDLWDAIEKTKICLNSISKEEALSITSVHSLYVKCHENNCYRSKIELITSMLKVVLITLKETIDYAIQLRLNNQRTSSELYNQPKPVDSMVENFGMDSQSIASSITRCLAFATAIAGLYKEGDTALIVVSCIFGVLTFFESYGIFFRGMRYRKRMTTHIRDFFANKYSAVLRNLFSLMTKDQRDMYPGQDPFLIKLESSVNQFISLAQYYGANDDHVREFQKAYERFRDSDRTETRIIHFIRELIERFIADLFHENSYLQEELVHVYNDLLEMRSLGRQNASTGMMGAIELFKKVKLLEHQQYFHSGKKENHAKRQSNQRKSLPLSIIGTSLRYMFAPLARRTKIVQDTSAIKCDANNILDFSGQASATTRSARDLGELHHASCEFELASAMMICAIGTLLFCLIMIPLRISELIIGSTGNIRMSNEVINWMLLFPFMGAYVAISALVRKLRYSSRLLSDIKSFRSNNTQLGQIRLVIMLRIVATCIQFLAIGAGMICIIWILVFSILSMDLNPNIPMYLSLGVIGAVLCISFLSSIVEYGILFNSDPCLANNICEVFRLVIDEIYDSYAKSKTGLEIETPQQLDMIAWEYTAREFLHNYRFDVVLDVNRLGMIQQCIQSGNKHHQPKETLPIS